MFHRILDFRLSNAHSAFLWGPRKTGKSTWLKWKFQGAIYYDLLKSDLFLRIQKKPSLVREELEFKLKMGKMGKDNIVILDEIQKIPDLLDEIHWMMENRPYRFILCGSSARKVKRGQANLLGGRAWRFKMFPLISEEIGEINLLQAINRGLLPAHYTDIHYKRTLKAYITDYLKEEILAEGLARNLKAFSLFLDSVAFTNGGLVNYLNISRDCGVDAKTVKEYFQILIDTHLGYYVPPFTPRTSRNALSRMPKFYLFDTGVANGLTRQDVTVEKGPVFGKCFEHFILMELKAYSSYTEKDFPIRFWRTQSGREVDFILGDNEIALECKGTSNVKNIELKVLKKYVSNYKPGKAYLISNDSHSRIIESIFAMYWRDFLKELWNGSII